VGFYNFKLLKEAGENKKTKRRWGREGGEEKDGLHG
jgi:hypothetical protein